MRNRSPQRVQHAAPPLVIDVDEPFVRWSKALPRRRSLCKSAAETAFATARPPAFPHRAGKNAAELGIILADDLLVRQLNCRWRGIDKPTNVLSFGGGNAMDTKGAWPLGAPLLLGDVVLALETLEREAAAQNKRLADHLQHLVVHGVLHLLGYDHEKSAEAERMEELETAILGRLGIADPYLDQSLPGKCVG